MGECWSESKKKPKIMWRCRRLWKGEKRWDCCQELWMQELIQVALSKPLSVFVSDKGNLCNIVSWKIHLIYWSFKKLIPKKMCTVLQQHLNRQNGIVNGESNGPAASNDYGTVSVSPSPAGGRAESVALTPAPIGGVSSYWVWEAIIHNQYKQNYY